MSEPIGARRQDHVTLLDLRVDNGIRIAGANQITAFVEVSDTLNANPGAERQLGTGGLFLSPIVIVPPRIVGVGFRLEW